MKPGRSMVANVRIVHHDVCDSQLQQFAGAKQAVESYQSPDTHVSPMPMQGQLSRCISTSCLVGKQHAGSLFRSQAECIRQDAWYEVMEGTEQIANVTFAFAFLPCTAHVHA